MKKFKHINNIEVASELIDELKRAGSVRLIHFGTFTITHRPGRMRFDFRKRKMVPHAATKQIRFKPSVSLRTLVNSKRKHA